MASVVFAITVLLVLSQCTIDAVDRNNFKTCEQSSFCRRCRNIQPGLSKFVTLPGSINVTEHSIAGLLYHVETKLKYVFLIDSLVDNTFRLRVNEETQTRARFQPVQALVVEPTPMKMEILEHSNDQIVVQTYNNKLVLQMVPFKIDLYIDGILVISANDLGRFVFEPYRKKEEQEQPDNSAGNGEEAEKGNTDGYWEEQFKEHTDTKPYGPMAVAMDFSFATANHVYGIPLHADSFSLKSTKGGDPYRLYNLDVFEYELYDKMALYGAVPFMVGHGVNGSAGVFWLNPSETWIEIEKDRNNEISSNVVESIVNFMSRGKIGAKANSGVNAYFMSETGIVDTFFVLGPGFYDVSRQYSRLTGTAPLPPLFALAYHQCRWNYNDQDDVNSVSTNFDIHDIPMDVIWLDIEHTDSKKYFTWDPVKFSSPKEMIGNLSAKGRKLVTIVDPHIKRDSNYFLHNDATSKNLYIKTKDGNDYEGWCWPGSSGYLDFLNPEVGEYYSSRFSFENYEGSTKDLFIWNDMNEPSVFSGPEVTMQKDCKHIDGWEHRDIHNIYGFLQTMYTYDGLVQRTNVTRRPFILTRSHFAGSQRFAAIWTGDNAAEWSHLKISVPMCLSSAIGGISFCGADVGGFFKNPDVELLVRWYQAGSYFPFFRAHAHLDTKRREPYLLEESLRDIVRHVIKERYALLPFWYTLFYEHERTGSPVMRPLFAEFPDETEVFEIDNEFLLGDSVLVCPVTEPGVAYIDVYFPGGENTAWYDKDTYERMHHVGTAKVPVPLSKIPVYIRGGSIIPRRNRVRRSSMLVSRDPYTLIAFIGFNGTAIGHLYIDDGESFEYREGNNLHLQFTFTNNQFTSHIIGNARYETESWLERIVIVGIPNIFRKAILTPKGGTQTDLDVLYDVRQQALTIRKPNVGMKIEWTISLH